MSHKNQRLFTILGAVAGAGAAAYGIRQGMRWYQRRQRTRRLDLPLSPPYAGDMQGYQPVGQQSSESIPITGPMTAAPPIADMTTAERVNSDMVSDFDDRGTAFFTTETDVLNEAAPAGKGDATTSSEMYGGATETRGPRGANRHVPGTEDPANRPGIGAGQTTETEISASQPAAPGPETTQPSGSWQFAPSDPMAGSVQPASGHRPEGAWQTPGATSSQTGGSAWPASGADRGMDTGQGMRPVQGMSPGQGLGTDQHMGSGRGMSGSQGMGTGQGTAAGQQAGMDTTTGQAARIVMDDYVAPLIEHAIAFNSVMNLLRSRQRDGAGHQGTESLTEGDRNSMRAVLDQMQQHVMERDETSLRGSPLALRSYNMTRKLRDALDNLSYSGADLFRIHGELRQELCSLARELENSGQVTITGLDQIRQLYEC